MWPFTRKPRVELEEFCRDFYDRQIVDGRIHETDVTTAFWDVVLDDLAKDSLLKGTPDRAAFHQEMTAIYFELFGLAWSHIFKRDKYQIPQAALTKHYLEEKDALDTWEATADYSQAGGSSITETPIRGQKMRRATVVMVTSMRVDLFDKWEKAGVDPECAARVANRLSSRPQWNSGATSSELVNTLGSRLSFEFLPQGRFRMQAVLSGLYEGAHKAIRAVNIHLPARNVASAR